MKPGYKTTEFWLSLSTSVIGLLVILGVITPDKSSEMMEIVRQVIGVVMLVLPQFGYTLSRGNAKASGSIDMSPFMSDVVDDEDEETIEKDS